MNKINTLLESRKESLKLQRNKTKQTPNQTTCSLHFLQTEFKCLKCPTQEMKNNQQITQTIFSSTVNCGCYPPLYFQDWKIRSFIAKSGNILADSLKCYIIKILNVYNDIYKEHLEAAFIKINKIWQHFKTFQYLSSITKSTVGWRTMERSV